MEIILRSPKYGSFPIFIDDEDYEKYLQHTWVLDFRENGKTYVKATVNIGVNKWKYIYLHRLIMGFPNGAVDHRNHLGTDNRKENLRIAFGGQNQYNQRKSKSNMGKWKGVYSFSIKTGPYAGRHSAKLIANGKKIWGGYFDTALEAAGKFNELAIEHHKEFACLNEFTDEEKAELAELKKNRADRPPVRKYDKPIGFRGVSIGMKAPKSKPYTAKIMVNRKIHHLGYFPTATHAAIAYNMFILKNGVNKVFLNKIHDIA